MATKKTSKTRHTAAKPAPQRETTTAASKLAALHRQHLPTLKAAATAVAETLGKSQLLRPGVIALHTGSAAGSVVMHCEKGGAKVALLQPGAEIPEPQIEVFGDPRRIAAIMRGEKDARMQFFAGGIRVRGDMAYLSEIGMKLGFLDRPLL